MHTKPVLAGWSAAVLVLVATCGATLASDLGCFSTFNSGSGSTTFNFCVSSDGTLLSLTSPSGLDHFSYHIREGYILCDLTGGSSYRDLGPQDNIGWGAPTIYQPNGANTFPLEITRTTTDGRFKLKNAFARNTTEREVKITMTLTNLTGTSRSVQLSRVAKGDINGDYGDDFAARTNDAVIQWENPLRGLELTTLSVSVPHTTFVSHTLDTAGCTPFSQLATPTAAGNFEGSLRHNFTIGCCGVTKTITVLYRRF